MTEFGLPLTCCAEENDTCTLDKAFNVGCSKQLFDIVIASMLLIGWIEIMFGVILVRNSATKLIHFLLQIYVNFSDDSSDLCMLSRVPFKKSKCTIKYF